MANNRLPFGLCKKYGIELPKDATPNDAWAALDKIPADEFKKPLMIPFDRVKHTKPDTISLPDEQLPRSVGAKWANYTVTDLATGIKYKFVEGTKLQNQEVFAGYKTRTPYRNAKKFSRRYGGNTEKWQHVKGIGVLDTDEGHRKAETHWSQCEGVGKVEFFIKRWLD